MRNFLAVFGAIVMIHALGAGIRDQVGGWERMRTAPNYGTIEIRPVGISFWSPWVEQFTYQQPYPGACWGWWRTDEQGLKVGIIETEMARYRWRPLPTGGRIHE